MFAERGKIGLALVWCAAAGLCLLLLTVHGEETTVAVAVDRTHLIRAPESGRLAAIDVVAGQRVEAGAVIGRIEVPGLTQQVAWAEAQQAALEEQLEAEENDRGRRFARDLEGARASWLGALVNLERERKELAGLESQLARLETTGVMAAGGEIAWARSERDAAKATVDARILEVAALDRAYTDARARAGGFASDYLKRAVEAAALEAESLRILADSNVLRAHVSGIVSAPVGTQARDGRTDVIDEVFPAPGQWMTAGMPVVMITEPATTQAVAFIPMAQARRLATGSPVNVRGEEGTHHAAKVYSIGASVEPVPLRHLRDQTQAEWGVPITLSVADRELLPGEALFVDF